MAHTRARKIGLWLGGLWGVVYLVFIVLNSLEYLDHDRSRAATLRGLTAVWLGIGLLVACCWQVVRFVGAFRGGYDEAEREDRLKRGCCLKCGYNLRGNASHICPECGTPTGK